MSKVIYKDFAVSTLLNAITASALSMSCQSGDGSLFPTIVSGTVFYVVLEDVDLNREIVRVTARAGNNFTIVRGLFGTSARAWAAGTIIDHRPLAEDFDNFLQATSLVSETWDPGSIADGDEEAKTVAVTDAGMGDWVVVSCNIDLQDLQMTAYVRAANSVRVVLSNSTGGAIDLDEMTLYIRVLKK